MGTGLGIEIGRENHRTLWRRVLSELAAAAGAVCVCSCVCVRVRDAAQWCVVQTGGSPPHSFIRIHRRGLVFREGGRGAGVRTRVCDMG